MSSSERQDRMTGNDDRETDLRKQAALKLLVKNLDKKISDEKARPKVPERPRVFNNGSSTYSDNSSEHPEVPLIPPLDRDRLVSFQEKLASNGTSSSHLNPSPLRTTRNPPEPPPASLKPKQSPPSRPALPKSVQENLKRPQPNKFQSTHVPMTGNGCQPPRRPEMPPKKVEQPERQSQTPPAPERNPPIRPAPVDRVTTAQDRSSGTVIASPSFHQALSMFQSRSESPDPSGTERQRISRGKGSEQSLSEPNTPKSVPVVVSTTDLEKEALQPRTRRRSASYSDSDLLRHRLRAKSSSPPRTESRRGFFAFLTKSTSGASPPSSRKASVRHKASKDEDKNKLKPPGRINSDRVSVDDQSIQDSQDFRTVGLRQVPKMESGIFHHETPEWKRQRYSDEYPQLFEYVLIVEVVKEHGHLKPTITYRYPKEEDHYMAKTDAVLNDIPQFCFPDLENLKGTKKSEKYSFVLTDLTGNRKFGYCRRIKSKLAAHAEVFCIISPLGCFEIYDKILDQIEQRRAVSRNAVFAFLQSIYNNPFPAPGRTVTVNVFSPTGKGRALDSEEMSFTRPMFSRLEHIDFGELFMTTSVKKVIYVFASLLQERRVILTAKKLSGLTSCCLAMAALLYPLSWQHVYIPVLPNGLIDMVSSPTPFFMGISPQAARKMEPMDIEDVMLLDLDSSKRLMKVGDEDTILPPYIMSFLQESLEDLLDSTPESKRCNSEDFNTQVSDIFLQVLLYFLARCPTFLEKSGEVFTFQQESYLDTLHTKEERKFMKVVCTTQMFDRFLEERENAILSGKPLNGYFEEKALKLSGTSLDPQQFFHVERNRKRSRFTRNKH